MNVHEIYEAAKKIIEILEKEELLQKDSCEKKVKLSELPVGGKFKTEIGNFIVLEQEGGETKVITEELYKDSVHFDEESTDYRNSKMCRLFDNEICGEFEQEFGAGNIMEKDVDLTTVDMQKDFCSCKCKVRPLTFDEARKYNNLIVSEKFESWYWTCTSWSTEKRGWKNSIAVVSPAGNVSRDYINYYDGVRPVCILKSNIFVSKEE